LGGVRKHHQSGFVAETGIPLTTISNQTPGLPLPEIKKAPLIQTLSGGTYQIKSVSYSKLDTFKVCPLKFKYRYLLQIPARPHHSLSFGRTLHSTLQQFHEQEMQGVKLSETEFLNLYQTNWQDEGYESEAQKQERFTAGENALKRYYHEYGSRLGQPKMLEQQFKLNLAGVTLVGKIDRIEIDKSGHYAIVDYKTGTPKDQKAADTDEQLTVYALAAKAALGIEAKSLSLYFLEEGGGQFKTTRTPEKLAKAQTKLEKAIETLKTSTFPPKPSIHTCSFCEYKRLCPYAKLK
jgi:DNA helicase-2/ATP-dependent DNA helicase PcrA